MRSRQRGNALRGLVVAGAIVGAIALQLAGARLQSRLADLVGIAGLAPAAVPAAAIAPAPSATCGATSPAFAMHPCKVAAATGTGIAPVI